MRQFLLTKKEYEFEKDNLIVLNVVIEGGGKVTIRMAVDRGATYSLIPWKIVQAIASILKKLKNMSSLLLPLPLRRFL